VPEVTDDAVSEMLVIPQVSSPLDGKIVTVGVDALEVITAESIAVQSDVKSVTVT
jgi:hypothetical protein